MDQLNLFEETDLTETIIPEDVLSPFECSSNTKSVKFRKVQERWHKYVKSISDTHNCSWFKASELLTEHRENQKPLKMRLVE